MRSSLFGGRRLSSFSLAFRHGVGGVALYLLLLCLSVCSGELVRGPRQPPADCPAPIEAAPEPPAPVEVEGYCTTCESDANCPAATHCVSLDELRCWPADMAPTAQFYCCGDHQPCPLPYQQCQPALSVGIGACLGSSCREGETCPLGGSCRNGRCTCRTDAECGANVCRPLYGPLCENSCTNPCDEDNQCQGRCIK